MTQNWLVVALSLGAALAFATSSTLKHVSAAQVPDAQDLAPRSVGRLVRATVAHPLWLAGAVADVVGLTLQVLALHLGALGVVQPLLITGLLFALILRQCTGHRSSRREILWGVVLTATLIGFLTLSGTAHHAAVHHSVDRRAAVVAAVVGVVLATTCVALGRAQRPSGRSAALLGVAVGAIYASTAALLKALTTLFGGGAVAVLTSWQLYAVLVVGAAGLVLNQLAFQAGPLAASLPAIATVDPLASIAIGVLVYGERVRHTVGAGFGLAALLLLLGVSVIQLSRLGAPRPGPADPSPPPATGAAPA